MAFYWGQGVGLPRIPPAFLLHPNTLKGLILCNFGFMCCFGIASSGKPRQISPSHSHTQHITSAPRPDSSGYKLVRNYEELKNKERDRQREISSKFQSAKSISCWSRQSPSAATKNPEARILLLGNTGNDRHFVYSVFNFSAKAKALFFISFA